MNKHDVIDALGRVDDDMIKQAEQARRKKRKPTWVKWAAMAACLCLVVVGAYQVLPDGLIGNIPTGEAKNGDNIVDLFHVDEDIYYIRGNGQLYQQSEGENTLIWTFPTHIIRWFEDLGGFVYYDDGTIFAYDPTRGINTPVVDVAIQMSEESPSYVILASGDHIYLKCSNSNYRVDIKSKEVSVAPQDMENKIYTDAEYHVFQSADYRSLHILELTTGTENIIAYEETDKPVVSGCIKGSKLYYVRSDGILKMCDLNLFGEGMEQKMIEVGVDERVLAVAISGKELLCVIGRDNNGRTETGVIIISEDGSISNIGQTGEPYYTIPGSCNLIANGHSYAFAVTTDSTMRIGSFD